MSKYQYELVEKNYYRSVFRAKSRTILERLIKDGNVQEVLEIGAYVGESTAFMAKLLPDEGKVTAIDIFSWQGWVPHEIKVEDQFHSNLFHEGVSKKVELMKIDHKEAYKHIEFVPDLIYIDGMHDEESVYRDCKNYYSLLKGGVLCGDDWAYCPASSDYIKLMPEDMVEGVRDYDADLSRSLGFPTKPGVQRFARDYGLTIYSVDNIWWIQK